MNTMTDNDTERYNGYANRETWAFNLHWQNDQGLYTATLDEAREYEADVRRVENRSTSDDELGEHVATYWREYIEDYMSQERANTSGLLDTFYREVGSWWRIDYAEVGAAVRESLDAEGMGEVDES